MSLQFLEESHWDNTNIKIAKWRIAAVIILGLGYSIFNSWEINWFLYWVAWLSYATLWLPLQGRHKGEAPNLWTYFFIIGDIIFFLLAITIEHNLLNNYSVLLIIPLFQYLLRYGRRTALHYALFSLVAVTAVCLVQYQAHPANHFLVVAVMFLIACNEGILVQENNELRKQLLDIAIYDELTGLFNYRFFTQAIEREMGRSKRYGYQLTFLVIDIDNFKRINDTHGHENGNKVLKALAAVISESIRDSDYAARYGGEEFVIILPQTSAGEGYKVAERIRSAIAQKKYDIGTVTVSIGASTYPDPSPDKDVLIKHADMAMYTAKNTGKNKVIVFNK